MYRFALPAAVALLATAAPLSAQVGVRSSSATSQSRDQSNEEIVVRGEKKELAKALRELIRPTGPDRQMARFEKKICPMVIGMPRDWTVRMTKLIRGNIKAAGAELEDEGCRPNALAIFIDQPVELIEALEEQEPDLFAMPRSKFAEFINRSGPVWSWQVIDPRSPEGAELSTVSVMGRSVFKTKSVTTSRLYSPVRYDMLAGFVVVDRPKTVGKTLRQIADLATMHLLLDVNYDAGAKDRGSILSLFEDRHEDEVAPARMSNFDRAALAGFYAQRDNNVSAQQQSWNIAKAIERGAGDEKDEKGGE